MRRARAWVAAAVACAIAGLSPTALAGAGRAPDHDIRRSRQVMGTIVTVTIWGDDDEAAARAIARVFDEFDRIEALMTSWNDTSVVARINATAGTRQWATVDPETFAVLRRALDISKLTHGAFDVTVGAFWDLWKFGTNQDGSIPTDEQIAQRVRLIGYRGVKLRPATRQVRLARRGMRITLGGIAKGYAVDRAVALLRAAGFDNFLVQAGGDLYVAGRKGDRNWMVGIRDPRGGRGEPFAIAPIEDRTFSTSGDYERGFVKDGVRYHHILDPRTGRPARRCRSVTVMAADAITADGLSTALFVMGPERGMKLVERLDGVEAVFVGADNRVSVSSGLRDRLRILKPPTDGI